AGPSAPAGGRFARLVARQDLTPAAVAGMVALAIGFGAAHALGPGHGKGVMAAYLVGTEGRRWDALLFGVVVSLMHTGAVLLLGLALFGVSRSTSVERIYPALTLLSGLAVAAMGGWLLRQRLRAGRGHHHLHDHDHDHDHHHGLLPHHHHAPSSTAVKPLSHRGLLVLAGSGAVVPSPSAVVALLGAFSVGQALLGLALVAAFSVGMAITLTAVGVALVLGRDFVQRRGERFLRLTPLAGAAALVVLGAFLSLQAISSA
ncbi:MAG TPA: hypothetical protein VE760_03045, partial [Acidimicrobiales bacterium]|nr:hypothetical protein [Acidimicrobiales bacterium]